MSKRFYSEQKMRVKIIDQKIKALLANEEFLELRFEIMKDFETKEMEKKMEDLENIGSKTKDAKKRGYTYDAKTYIELTIKQKLFDSRKMER